MVKDRFTIREVAVKYKGQARVIAGSVVSNPGAVARFVRKLVDGDGREHFIVLHLDGRHRPTGYQTTSIGTASATLVHPREVFQSAISLGACALIVVHNHPSGDPDASTEDCKLAERLWDAGELLGIPVLDFVIVGEGCHSSMKEEYAGPFGGRNSR
jgi:DNA repair protein RadC